MQITIGEYRIRRYDNLNLCVEQKKIKQKAKNPYGRNGKQGDIAIAQNNSCNKVQYKWHLICYSTTLDYCLKKLVEHCLTNDDEINTIKELQNQITELNEKISAISESNNRAIEQNILSNKVAEEGEDSKYFDELAEEWLN